MSILDWISFNSRLLMSLSPPLACNAKRYVRAKTWCIVVKVFSIDSFKLNWVLAIQAKISDEKRSPVPVNEVGNRVNSTLNLSNPFFVHWLPTAYHWPLMSTLERMTQLTPLEWSRFRVSITSDSLLIGTPVNILTVKEQVNN